MRAEFWALLAVVSWSTVATAFKLSLVHMRPTALVFLASAVSFTIYTGLLFFRGNFCGNFRIPRRSLLKLMGLGCLNPSLYYLILFNAYDRLPAQIAQPLNQIWPLVLALMSVVLLGHRLNRSDITGMGLGLVGVIVVSTGGSMIGTDTFDRLGVILALFSSIIWAAYWLWSVRANTAEPVKLFVNFAVGTLVTGLFAWHSGSLTKLTTAGLIGSLYVGCFEMGFAFICWMKALQKTTNIARVANLVYITPVLSLCCMGVVLGEEILPATLIGLGFILGGLFIQRRSVPL